MTIDSKIPLEVSQASLDSESEKKILDLDQQGYGKGSQQQQECQHMASSGLWKPWENDTTTKNSLHGEKQPYTDDQKSKDQVTLASIANSTKSRLKHMDNTALPRQMMRNCMEWKHKKEEMK